MRLLKYILTLTLFVEVFAVCNTASPITSTQYRTYALYATYTPIVTSTETPILQRTQEIATLRAINAKTPYNSVYTTYYSQTFRDDPDRCKEKKIIMGGRVVEITEDHNFILFGMAEGKEFTFFVFTEGFELDTVVGDIVDVYGICRGGITAKRRDGSSYIIPVMVAAHFILIERAGTPTPPPALAVTATSYLESLATNRARSK